MATGRALILLIGNDPALAYLLKRYTDQSGYELLLEQAAPSAEQACSLHPAAILFGSIERLESAQPLVEGLANCDIPLLVCSSIAEDARARELGVDHCLTQPFTYDGFLTALAAARGPETGPP